MTTKKQRVILLTIIRHAPELTTLYAEALTEAYAEGIQDGLKIAEDQLEKVFHG